MKKTWILPRLVADLSRELGDEFGKGISVANLWNFRQFYLTFPDFEKLYAARRESPADGKSYALRSQLSWTHWRLVMRVENPQARDYYIDETARQQWSSRALERAIETRSFKAPPSSELTPVKPSPLHFLKDPYILEFLDLPESPDPDERALEDALVIEQQQIGAES